MRPLVIDEGKIRQLRDSELLTGVQYFTEGQSIVFTPDTTSGNIIISTTVSTNSIDGGSPSSTYEN
jgi:hypothetical protein